MIVLDNLMIQEVENRNLNRTCQFRIFAMTKLLPCFLQSNSRNLLLFNKKDNFKVKNSFLVLMTSNLANLLSHINGQSFIN